MGCDHRHWMRLADGQRCCIIVGCGAILPDGYFAPTEEELEPFASCQNVQHNPAEYVTREMALAAGEPTMEGTLLHGATSGPCGACDGCRARAAIKQAKGD